MNSFLQYSDILFDGFSHNSKSDDLLIKKQDILKHILDYYNLLAQGVLFVGFSPWCLTMTDQHFYITEVSNRVLDYLRDKNCNFTHVSFDSIKSKSMQISIAADEYFTFAESDQMQRDLVNSMATITEKLIITTLRDYKNQDFKEREFSQPIMIRGKNSNNVYLEHYEYDIKDKNSSISKMYMINDDNSQVYGPFARRNMYFKQLAKFSLDAGAVNFYVHKNIMYKSVIKKNYEHVITIEF